jgi:hypothetical protein
MATAKKIVMAAAGGSSTTPALTQAFHSGVLAGGTSQSAYTTWAYTFTAPALPSGYVAGERQFFIMTGTRDSGGAINNNRYINTLSSMRIENSANSIDVTTTRANMTIHREGHSEYNNGIIGHLIADAVGSTTITVTRDYSQGGGSDYMGVLVVDGVTQINAFDSNQFNSGSSSSSSTVTSVNTLSAVGTSQLRMVVGASSNSGTANPVYNKTTNEPTYTTLGQGENGTAERYGMFYSFEAAGGNSTQAIDGTVTTSTASANGLAYAAALINLS